MSLETTKEVLRVMKMRVRNQHDPVNYANALSFWKSVEEKYEDRKRRWIEGTARLETTKADALMAKNKIEDIKRATRCTGTMAEPEAQVQEPLENFAEAKDAEFSDVDPDMFNDPFDRYYR